MSDTKIPKAGMDTCGKCRFYFPSDRQKGFGMCTRGMDMVIEMLNASNHELRVSWKTLANSIAFNLDDACASYEE